jgi:hypothetical protein
MLNAGLLTDLCVISCVPLFGAQNRKTLAFHTKWLFYVIFLVIEYDTGTKPSRMEDKSWPKWVWLPSIGRFPLYVLKLPVKYSGLRWRCPFKFMCYIFLSMTSVFDYFVASFYLLPYSWAHKLRRFTLLIPLTTYRSTWVCSTASLI